MRSKTAKSSKAYAHRSDLGYQGYVSPRHSTAFVLSLLFGGLGLGRYYIGRNGIAILQLLSLAATFVLVYIFLDSPAAEFIFLPLVIWLLIDDILIGSGKARDANGNPLIIFGSDPPVGYCKSHISEKHTPALILSGIMITNMLGIDRMYTGRVGLGILKLIVGVITLGFGAFIWGLVDYILIGRGRARDGKGRHLIAADVTTLASRKKQLQSAEQPASSLSPTASSV